MTFEWNSKTILVAEDEPANFLFIEKIIKPTQAKIIRAENGMDALAMAIENEAIDVVLMDIYMPGMDGYEAAAKIKAQRPDLPIIAQTFYENQIDQDKMKQDLFDAFIKKPININKLLAVLEKHLKTND